ncbi:hypothetical protein Pse7367_2681 [Thalassoporum mexicanum PCC 7367]|uniref:hypothetical protein n=1 Tax=Thalassoporum mexicanum TaxID=3457544 RepID=UPI00029F8DC0|nr:hypothetical protein [Pseudanabaena sp. PCC 7367]AFY70936.1 hypothetical protein Pse7367_2681 [Pseudanabaena sp. PCC 7367]
MTPAVRLQIPIAIASLGLAMQVMLAAVPPMVRAQDNYAANYFLLKSQVDHQPRRQTNPTIMAQEQKIEATDVVDPIVNPTNNQPQTEAPNHTNTGEKLGATRQLPSLQTRARPPLQPDTLHLGMVQAQFFEYAADNNWLALETQVGEVAIFYQWLPGGEGIYALPEKELVYASGFIANVYFQDGRLVGMRLLPDRREKIINSNQLLSLARAWFPDDVLSILYQVVPEDPNQLVIDSLIGSVPEEFKTGFGSNKLPFCQVVLFPAPVPLQASLSSCAEPISAEDANLL